MQNPSYYGTNEGDLKGWPLTHMIIDDFFKSLIDRNEEKLLKKHADILKDLRKAHESEFKRIKRDIKFAAVEMKQLKAKLELVNSNIAEMKTAITALQPVVETTEVEPVKPKKKRKKND